MEAYAVVLYFDAAATEKLRSAAAEVLQFPFTAQAEKIVLARCVPYVEVAEWELKG